jgi:ATP-dependent helicase HrpB
MREAVNELRALHLTDDSGHLTAQGKRVSRLPVGVREARALLAGAHELGDVQATAEIVAALSDDYRDPGAELPRLLRELRLGRTAASDRWRAESRRLAQLVPAESGAPITSAASEHSLARDSDGSRSAPEAVGAVLALSRPEWIARRVAENSRSYLLASGSRAALPEKSGLLGSEWIAISAMQRASGRAADGTGAVIRLAAPITEADALRIGDVLVTRDRAASVKDGRVRVREEQRLGAILLASTPASPTDADTGPAFTAHLREKGLTALEWSETATRLRSRLTMLARELGAPWPEMSDKALFEDIERWLGPDLERLSATASLRRIDVAAALRRLLPWPQASRLDELVPERLTVPSGTTTSISYPNPDDPTAPPVIAVKLQEMFGLAQTPRLVDGRVPVLVHLLSPARRPLAVTDDLASFWNGPYQEVRREMRGRYPKHPWPEDPWAAQATARTSHPRPRR